MRVTEVITFDQYNIDPRFSSKRPFRNGSRKQSCGDNIYFRSSLTAQWNQRDSFHSREDGTIHERHVQRDTGVNRVLVSEDFVYFGGSGPTFPDDLKDSGGRPLCKSGIGRNCFEDPELIQNLERWIRSLGVSGYQSAPYEWITLRG
jgi:hypothetical protein